MKQVCVLSNIMNFYNIMGQDKLRKVHALSGLKRKPKELLQKEKQTCNINPTLTVGEYKRFEIRLV